MRAVRGKTDYPPAHDHFRSYSCRSRLPVLICVVCPTSEDVGLYMRSTEVYWPSLGVWGSRDVVECPESLGTVRALMLQ
jgi:hypothetical protein